MYVFCQFCRSACTTKRLERITSDIVKQTGKLTYFLNFSFQLTLFKWNTLENGVVTMECINRFQVLCYEQVVRLHEVMEGVVPIHGRGNFPTLDITLKKLVQAVRDKLQKEGISVRDIRLNGGAASYIFGTENIPSYNDVDLIFGVDLSDASSNHTELQKIKHCVLGCLLDFLPEGVNKEKMSSCSMKEAYVQKMVKVCNEHGDKWSLISLSNNKGRNIELKFVDKMKRQFEFSVDSFQVILDSLLKFYEISSAPMSEHFLPNSGSRKRVWWLFSSMVTFEQEIDCNKKSRRNPRWWFAEVLLSVDKRLPACRKCRH